MKRWFNQAYSTRDVLLWSGGRRLAALFAENLTTRWSGSWCRIREEDIMTDETQSEIEHFFRRVKIQNNSDINKTSGFSYILGRLFREGLVLVLFLISVTYRFQTHTQFVTIGILKPLLFPLFLKTFFELRITECILFNSSSWFCSTADICSIRICCIRRFNHCDISSLLFQFSSIVFLW